MNYLDIANTEEGRYLIGKIGGVVPQEKIIHVTKNSFVEYLGEEKGKHHLRATIFSGNSIARIFEPILEKIKIAQSMDWRTFRMIQENEREAFLHYAGLIPKYKKYPQIALLTTPDIFASDNAWIFGGGDASWATERAKSTGTASKATNIFVFARLDGVYGISRGAFNFDISADVPVGATITGLTASFAGNGKGTDVDSHTFNIYAFTGNDTIVDGDFDLFGTTPFCNSPIALSAWNTSGYNNFSGNAAAIAAVQAAIGGLLKIGLRDASHDVANVTPATSGNTYVSAAAVDTAGTSSDPKIVINYTVGGAIPVIVNFNLVH